MKRTKEDVRRENVKFIAECTWWALGILVFCPGFISLLVGYAIGR